MIPALLVSPRSNRQGTLGSKWSDSINSGRTAGRVLTLPRDRIPNPTVYSPKFLSRDTEPSHVPDNRDIAHPILEFGAQGARPEEETVAGVKPLGAQRSTSAVSGTVTRSQKLL